MVRAGRSAASLAVLIGSLVGIYGATDSVIGQSTWTQTDIGSSRTAGTASQSGASFTITAAGTDIGGNSDQFFFAYQVIDGDVDIRARLDDVTARNSNAQAGVMIRGGVS